MCMFCAAIPVAGAVGAKVKADQHRAENAIHSDPDGIKPGTEKQVVAVTAGVMVLLLIGSVIYHTSVFGQ